jgi:hypothetical protein
VALEMRAAQRFPLVAVRFISGAIPNGLVPGFVQGDESGLMRGWLED